MSALAAVTAGRAMAESIMTDACVIKRKTADVVDPDTGKVTPFYGLTVYTGKCRIQLRGLVGGSPDVGEQRVDQLSLELQIPISATEVLVNDVVTMTASADPELVNRPLRVANLMHKTHATARRMGLDEITS